MDKNVYSLVLLDDVVDAVDRMAYERNTSRSSLVNRILAEYLSCPIPETRIHDIFDCMEQVFSNIDNFHVQFQPSDTMISIRSALRYRYNPTLRYLLELFRQSDPAVGELRVSLRSQNRTLLRLLTEFFLFWDNLENKWIGSLFEGGKVPARVEPGRYTRRLMLPRQKENQTNEKIAKAISDYIREFDAVLKAYFAEKDSCSDEIGAEAEETFRKYLVNAVIL